MQYKDFLLLREGWIKKKDRLEDLFRTHATLVIHPHIKTSISKEKLWPMASDIKKSIKSSKAALKQLAELRKGGFIYVKHGNRIVKQKISDN